MNTVRPDVSVIIPVYNRLDLLPRAIRSALSQSCTVEIIVIDDGSADDPGELLRRHFPRELEASRPAPLRLLRQENRGACAARNTGLDAAAGEFVKFLDSDDELLPDALPQEVRAARASGCEALVTGWEERTWRPDGTEDLARRRTRPSPDLDRGIDAMLIGIAPWTSAALYRTEFVRPLRWDPAWTKAQDWGWALVVCLAGARFETLAIPSCIYHHHPGPRVSGGGHRLLRSTRARQQMLAMVENGLREQDALTDSRKPLLAQYLYRDAQVLARHDPAEWRRVWRRIQELCPGFVPREPNRAVRFLSRLFGVETGIRTYVALKRLLLPFRD